MSVVCGACGKEVQDGSRYCNWCGESVEAAEMAVTPEGKVCPYCGTTNPEVSAFCQNCTKDFPPPARPSIASDDGPPTVKCWHCGAKVAADKRTCDECGATTRPDWVEIRDAPRAPKAPMHAAILFAAAGVLDIISALRILTAEHYAVPDIGVDVGGMLCICGALTIIFACCAFSAALTSYRRESFTLTLLAGVLGMLGVGPFFLGSLLALIGVILVAMNRDEYYY